MMRSNVTLCLWNGPAPLAEKKTEFIFPDLCPPNSPVDYGICGLMQKRMYILQTPVCLWHQPLWPATWSSVSLTHMAQNVIDKAAVGYGESSYVQAWRQITSLWTSAKLKPALFRASTLRNRLFSEPPTVYRGNTLFHFISVAAI